MLFCQWNILNLPTDVSFLLIFDEAPTLLWKKSVSERGNKFKTYQKSEFSKFQ
jgi:hypothetical protein